MNIICAACRAVVKLPDKVGFRDTCPSCDAYLHSCVNCMHWEGSRCLEPSAEKVGDPVGINFCDWYRGIAANSTDEEKQSKGKENAEELWKNLSKK
jgi:hypothetical protein